MSRLERLFLIDAAIRSNRFPRISTLSAEHEVTERTIKADLRYLKDRVRAPLKHDRRRGGYVYTDPSFVLPRLILTEREADAIRRALKAARELGGVAGDAEALALLAARVGGLSTTKESGPTVAGGVRLAASALVPAELLNELEEAVKRRRRVAMRYHGNHRGAETERTVQPWHLYAVEGEWYVTGFCELRQTQRDFHLSRALAWKSLPEEGAFRIPDTFDGDAYVRAALVARHGEPGVTVRVRFTPYQSRWISERVYHPSQVLETLPDGSTVLSMTVTGTWEARRWVLGFGAEAEVLEPSRLREELAEEIEKLRKIYKRNPEGSSDSLPARTIPI